MDSINWCLSNHEKDSENNVNLLFKPHFPHYGRHGEAYLTFGGKNTSGNNNDNNNNFISIALLSYVQGALQSCKQHY